MTGELLYEFERPHAYYQIAISPDHAVAALYGIEKDVLVFQRRRPEWLWGVAWMPEFWVTLIFVIALPRSLRRDGKRFVARKIFVDRAAKSG